MELLNKSMDSLIDELFTEQDVSGDSAKVEKSMIKDSNPAKETADEAVRAAPKGEKDESRGAGRPEQISDVPQSDEDGSRSGEYDKKIAKKQEEPKKAEDSQVEPPKDMKKSFGSVEEYAEFLALKKAKEVESLAKAQKEQSDLMKSIVSEAVRDAVSSIKSENESLKKSLSEQSDLIKSMANKPQKAKAITSVQAVEKFQKSAPAMGKAELLDVAEDLVKAGKLTMEHAIELENNSFIYDEEARSILEREVARRYR
jgi:hypothetical protein